jgi:hypothetical protein
VFLSTHTQTVVNRHTQQTQNSFAFRNSYFNSRQQNKTILKHQSICDRTIYRQIIELYRCIGNENNVTSKRDCEKFKILTLTLRWSAMSLDHYCYCCCCCSMTTMMSPSSASCHQTCPCFLASLVSKRQSCDRARASKPVDYNQKSMHFHSF